MPTKLEPPSVVRMMASQVPEPLRHRAVPSSHHSSRLTDVNEAGWKSAGITPPFGPVVAVLVDGVVEVVEVVAAVAVVVASVVDDVVIEGVVDVVVVVDVVEAAGVLLQAAAVRARAAMAATTSPGARSCFLVICFRLLPLSDRECDTARGRGPER
jgi:hypothetical protein